MKVSFDFDGTLSRKDVQEYAKELILLGMEIYVVTSRYQYLNREDGLSVDNSDLWKIVNKLGIKPKNLVFTEMKWKSEFFKDNNEFAFHLDDCYSELIRIQKASKVPAISVNGNWKKKCNKAIKN
jgi:hypothetical protein